MQFDGSVFDSVSTCSPNPNQACSQVGYSQVGYSQVGYSSSQVGYSQVGYSQVGYSQVGYSHRLVISYFYLV